MGDGTYVSLTPFHMGEPGRMAGQTNNNNNNNQFRMVCLMVIEQAALESWHSSVGSGFWGARRRRKDVASFVHHGGGVSFVDTHLYLHD